MGYLSSQIPKYRYDKKKFSVTTSAAYPKFQLSKKVWAYLSKRWTLINTKVFVHFQ